MNIFEIIRAKLTNDLNLLAKNKNIEIDDSKIVVELPKNESHGDLATNAALVMAKYFKCSPMQLAQEIQAIFQNYDEIKKSEIAAPGFINITLNNQVWQDIVLNIIQDEHNFGKIDLGKGSKINIEFASVNPTGPMHIGHARNAVFGDVLANLLKYVGYNVTKEYYINDAGNQINNIALSVYYRYLEQCKYQDIKEPEGFYPGEYLVDVAIKLKDEFDLSLIELDELERMQILKEKTTDMMMDLIKQDLLLLNIQHDVFFSEKSMHQNNEINNAIKNLTDKNLTYYGTLEQPKNELNNTNITEKQLLFKSTDFGDDLDRVIQKTNGEWTYFAADIAYAANKVNREFKNLIVILGADHNGYIKRLSAATQAISNNQVNVNVHTIQLVNFIKNNQQIKMSKRAGNYVTVKDIVEMVGKDSIRFIMLTRKNDMVLDFDIEIAKEQSKDNPIFYIQYAYARCHSILNRLNLSFEEVRSKIDPTYVKYLSSKSDIELIKFMASWPKTLKLAAQANEPHRIAFYLIELAAKFHALWNKGKDDSDSRFIIDDDSNITNARILLIKSVIIILRTGLDIFNIKPKERM